MTYVRYLFAVFATLLLCTLGVHTQQPGPPPTQAPASTLYLVSNSHLDTQWNWTVQDTIRELVPPTFYDNFALFERFPNYVFNYEGAIHYMWFKEYHPDDWPRLQKYVADGRWKLSGSWLNAADTNIPSPEALMRQALYGKRFFRQEFARTPQDIYLPDCFGFGFALPSIGAHSGITAFSTQKLSWGAAKPTPFAVGLWKGVDGSNVVASLRAGDYVMDVRSDVSTDAKWNADLVTLGDGSRVGFRYFGVGDQGGAPDATSVEWVEKALANSGAPVRVRNTSADQLSRDLTEAQRASLPVYEGELLLKTHGVGCYTSQAAMKAFNRKNEQLADAAERASVAAEWIGGPAYPRDALRAAWTRFLWHQFHDDLTGTSIPQAYQFSWNDELISSNQFAAMLTAGVNTVASGLDTRPGLAAAGHPTDSAALVVFNALGTKRSDPVEAQIRFPGAPLAAVRVVDTTTGREVPAQVLSSAAGSASILFVTDMPPVSFKVFEVRRASAPMVSRLEVTAKSLENARYLVTLDANGDVASIRDKDAGLELLEAPARLELFDNPSFRWPAWEILWETVSKPPREYVQSPVVRIAESGAARIALEVTRHAAGSTIVQRIQLAENGDRVEFDTRVDWRSPGTLLKASFPLAASNPKATYDLGLGTFERPNATAGLYEVPAQQWADITDAGGTFGTAIANDSKYGWDKPADNELRLTLIHTPRPNGSFVYQSSNDIGHHRFVYAVAGHRGDWRAGRVPARAMRLNQPLIAFQSPSHAGAFGRSLALLDITDTADQVAVRAFKKAEDSDEWVVRVQELYGRPAPGVAISIPGGIRQAREVNAAEERIGEARVDDGRLTLSLNAYQPRTFALTPAAPSQHVPQATSTSLELPFSIDGISTESAMADGNFDGAGRSYPAEQLPATITVDGLAFRFGPSTPSARNVVAAAGQRIALPPGTFTRLYVLASAIGGDQQGTIAVERQGGLPTAVPFKVQEWSGALGQWDSRLRDDRMMREVFTPVMKDQSWLLEDIESQMVTKWVPPAKPGAGKTAAPAPAPAVATVPAVANVQGLSLVKPGFVKRDEVAWVATHRHAVGGNEPYVFGYIFKYAVDLPAGATAVVLPKNDRIRIFAITAANEPTAPVRPTSPLYAGELGTPRQ